LALLLQYEIAGSARGRWKNQLSVLASWVLLALHFPWPVIPVRKKFGQTPDRDKDVTSGPGIEARGTECIRAVGFFFAVADGRIP
jgi:hypothetical protein